MIKLFGKDMGVQHDHFPLPFRREGEVPRTRSVSRGQGEGKDRGFTLIEVMIVVIIIGILAAVVIPRFVGRTEDARRVAVYSDVATIGLALDAYEADTGEYPSDIEVLVDADSDVTGWHGPYLKKKPTDPWGNDYVYNQSGGTYELYSTGKDGSEHIPTE